MDRTSTKVVWDAPAEETERIYEDIGIKVLDGNEDDYKEKESQKRRYAFTTPENQQQTPTKKTCTGAKHACKCQLFQDCAQSDESDCFEGLSDEIMLGILRWLPQHQLARCAAISKRWNRLCMDDYLWKTADFSERKFCSGTLARVLEPVGVAAKLARSTIHGPLLLTGDNGKKSLGDIPLRLGDIPLHLGDFPLQYLDLSMCNTDPGTLAALVGASPRLRKLSLESCMVNSDCLRRLGLIAQLEELNLCMCQDVEGGALCAAILKLSRVKALNVGWLNLSRNHVSIFITSLPRGLEKLNLSGCRNSLLDRDVERLVARCPSLTELDLSDANSLTGDIFESLQLLPNLQHLALSRCYKIPSPAQLAEYLKRLRSLRAVELFGLVSEHNLKGLCNMVPQVQINIHPFCSIARPTMSHSKRRFVWEVYCRP